ncbi:MAG: histidine kinase dimerization/phospho-acceptor domain-containing protein, partial [Saprospiraceae bacterium]
MNQYLQALYIFLQESTHLNPEEKARMLKSIKDVDKELEIALFKLDRTERVKKTTAILLEETIEELEQKRKAIEETNDALTKSMAELKAAQSQLIQSEKMASLGELTAGIAHEIQNPLNFVNNFSDVSQELLNEMIDELAVGNQKEAISLAEDVKQNLEKILSHGRRADSIVKGML